MTTTSEAATGQTENTEEPDRTRTQQAADQARAHLGAAARHTYHDLRQVTWRNRRQLAPLELSAGAGALGSLGALATQAPEITDAAATGSVGLVAAAGATGVWWWLKQKIAARWRRRLQAGLGAAGAWSTLLPVTGADHPGMWLALAGGTVALSARWWQHHRPAHPDPITWDPTPVPAKSGGPGGPAEAAVRHYNLYLADGKGVLAGSHARNPRVTENGFAITIDLIPGQQHRSHVESSYGALATALDYPEAAFTAEKGRSEAEVDLRVTVTSPHTGSVNYDGPTIVTTDDGNVYLEIGPYQDGDGSEYWHVAGPDSLWGGFVLGSTGSGKSRFFESLAIAYRKMGYVIWWLDPQSGASSEALKRHADWPLMGVSNHERTYGNALDLLEALEGIVEVRNLEQGLDDSAEGNGFTHSRARPGIVVMIDECQEVLNKIVPGTKKTFGAAFAEKARILRKLGMTLICGSQTYDLPTFGGQYGAPLRDALITGNCVLMRVSDRNTVGTVPDGASLKPWRLPEGGGYGFSTTSRRPNVVWRARYVRSTESWLAQETPGELDQRAFRAAGPAYAHRWDRHERQRANNQAKLDAFDAGHSLNSLHGHGDSRSTSTGRVGTTRQSAPTPPSEARLASVTAMPASPSRGSTEDPTAEPSSGEGGELGARHQEIVDLLTDYEDLSTAQLAEEVGVSEQAIRKRISVLRESGRIRETRQRGVYTLAR